MTRLLLRLFVRNADQTGDPKVRSAYGVLSGAVGILCNFLLFAGKLAVGTISGSVSVTADAVNNLSDASSSIVTLVGFRIAEKPADEGHPYGHARVEYLSGLVVAALILIIGVELAKTSVEKIFHPVSGGVFPGGGGCSGVVHFGQIVDGSFQPGLGTPDRFCGPAGYVYGQPERCDFHRGRIPGRSGRELDRMDH